MDVSQYLEIFIDETKEHLQTLSDQLMILETEPDNMETINEIFRAAHSLKGMAGTMGYKRMQRLTHDMENVFQEIRSGNMKVQPELIDVLFRGLDALEGYLANILESADEGTEDNEEIINTLNSIADKAKGGTGEVPVPTPTAAPSDDKSAASDGNKAKYENIRISDYEKATFEKAKEENLNILGITVYLQDSCILKAARAFLVFKCWEELGEVMKAEPNVQDIEDEKFDFDFSLVAASSHDLQPIIDAIKAVSEIEGVDAGETSFDKFQQEEAAPAVQEEKPEAEHKPEEKQPEAPKSAKASVKSKKVTNNKPVTARTVRVDIEKLDALMNQVSELIIAKNSLVSLSDSEQNGEGNNQSFHDQIEYLERITTNLHESVMKVRMVPIESVVNKFPRMIRDLSRKLNKPMELYMSGEETELDRTVVDQIGDPLQHLLRNSADHGIESPEERRKAGKPETGSIILNAFQEGNNVIIEVKDDGAGLDTEKIKEKAIERGFVTPDQAENLSQKEIIDFLFMPSFSMAKKITDISGRGVGLDVVKSNIEALGGDVTVKSIKGTGTTFIVRLPLTLAIIQALMVEVRDEKYAIALGSIQNIENIPVSDIKYVQAEEVIHLRGMVIPLIRLDQMLDSAPSEEEPENLTVVIVRKGDNYAGLVVDDLIGQQEIVIKSLGKCIDNNKIINGATILGDGEVALIIDVNAIF